MLMILLQSLELPTSLFTEELTVKTLLLAGLIFYINKDAKNKEEIEKLREKNKEEVDRLRDSLEIRLREKDSLLDDCERDLMKKELELIIKGKKNEDL